MSCSQTASQVSLKWWFLPKRNERKITYAVLGARLRHEESKTKRNPKKQETQRCFRSKTRLMKRKWRCPHSLRWVCNEGIMWIGFFLLLWELLHSGSFVGASAGWWGRHICAGYAQEPCKPRSTHTWVRRMLSNSSCVSDWSLVMSALAFIPKISGAGVSGRVFVYSM